MTTPASDSRANQIIRRSSSLGLYLGCRAGNLSPLIQPCRYRFYVSVVLMPLGVPTPMRVHQTCTFPILCSTCSPPGTHARCRWCSRLRRHLAPPLMLSRLHFTATSTTTAPCPPLSTASASPLPLSPPPIHTLGCPLGGHHFQTFLRVLQTLLVERHDVQVVQPGRYGELSLFHLPLPVIRYQSFFLRHEVGRCLPQMQLCRIYHLLVGMPVAQLP